MGVDGQVRTSERGLSTILGVVLMISVVVILASVVGVYLVSFGENTREPARNIGASVDFDQRTTGNGQYLNITFSAGRELATDDLVVRVEDARSVAPGGATEEAVCTGSVLSMDAGSTFGVGETLSFDRTDFEEADGDPIAGGKYLDLTDATITLYYRGSDSSKPVFRWSD